MSGSVALWMDSQDTSALVRHRPSVAPEPRRQSVFLSRMVLLSSRKRIRSQKSSSSLVPNKEEAQLTLRKSLSCMAFQKEDNGNYRKEEDGNSANLRTGTKADSRVSKPLLVASSWAECRICQEEDDLANLEAPCVCSGSLKFAHRSCVQHWCNEKGDTVCEICKQPYEGGYSAPPSSARSDAFSISIGESWDIASGQRFDLHEPRLFTVTSERIFSEAEYEAHSRANEQSAACFSSVALILMILLLVRHVLSVTSSGADENQSTFFLLFALRTAGFFLPCYIMARALNMLQCRRQRQEATLEAAEVAYLLRSGYTQDVQIAVAPGIMP